MNIAQLIPAITNNPAAQALLIGTSSSNMTITDLIKQLKNKADADYAAETQNVVSACQGSMDAILADALRATV